MCVNFYVFGLLSLVTVSTAQRDVALPFSANSFQQILRTFMSAPEGRSADLSDVRIRFYGPNSTKPTTYSLGDAKRLLADPQFDPDRPTTLYIHGYVELWNDPSVATVARVYRRRGLGLLLLDWSNLAFGNYLTVALRVQKLGQQAGKVVWRLLKSGLALPRLHVVGHSMGVAIAGVICRYLAAKGYLVPRLTGLDPAYPGFYPPLLGPPAQPGNAAFVDMIHTDGGAFGAPVPTGDADFWPNAGSAKQPGCPPLTLPLTTEDFCSHWRSWQYWAEAVASSQPVFLARRCDNYDSFLRGACRGAPLVVMGLDTDPTIRGNFYLRTAEKEPFALGERGAD